MIDFFIPYKKMSLNQLATVLASLNLSSPDSSPSSSPGPYSFSTTHPPSYILGSGRRSGTLSPIPGGTTPPESNEDVRFILRNQRRYQLPEGGVVLPVSITIPAATAPRSTIMQFGAVLGFSMPASYNRPGLIERLRQNLQGLGYIAAPGTPDTFTRPRPITLQLEGEVRGEVRGEPSAQNREEEIRLPEIITTEVFRTIGTMAAFIRDNHLSRYIRTGSGRLKNDIARDIREFVTEQGYAIDPRGNFVRRGGTVIAGGFEFNDLITTQEYIRILQTEGQIQINQVDLVRLNITLINLLSTLTKRRWPSFEAFTQEVSQALNVPAPVVSLASLLINLQHVTNTAYTTILRAIGDIRTHRRMEDRLNAILGYLRQKIQLIPQTYPKRESFKGPATTTMTLEEAIRGGYQFDEGQYAKQIDELLNRSRVPSSHRRTFVQLIQQYPDMYDIFRDYGRNSTSFAHGLVRLYYPEVPGMVQELYTYAVNYPLVFSESQQKILRRQQITALPRAYLDTLYQIYSTRDLENILDTDQNPLELYLTAIAKVKVNQLPALVANFGMITPEHLLTRDVRRYVLQFMHEYRDIIIRSPDIPLINQVINGQPENVVDFIAALARYTDQEIMTYFGYVAGFENRNTLIENIFQNVSEEGFMVYKEINANIAINTQTTLLMDISDLLKPYLVFGTPFRYRILELDELLGAFNEEYNDRQEITGFKFTKIGGLVTESYTIGQVSRLQSLLPAMKNMNGQLATSVDQILERIRSGIIRTMKRNAEVDAIIRDVKRAGLPIQNLVKEIFYKIFYAGMYMRRWKGPGNKFPVVAASTRGGGDPQAKSIAALAEVSELMHQLEVANKSLHNRLRTIPEIDYRTRADEIVILSHAHLFDLVGTVAQGGQCIRIASRHFVLTANYYIGVMFGEVIPDFDPHSVDSIS